MHRAVGYLLHPLIQRTLPPSPHIAELTTGTGAFLVDLAHTLPSNARLDAYDISSDSFLPKSELPANVNLNVSDARLPPSDAAKGVYDVVCIRMLNCGLMPDDWQAVAQHAWTLLKPGGALQWIEGDLLQVCTPLRSEPETKTAALEKGSHLALGHMEQLKWFIPNLRIVLQEVGFRDVRQMVSSLDRVSEDRKQLGWLSLMVFYSALCAQAHTGGEGALAQDQVEKLREEMLEESEAGSYVRFDMHQFVAWKPA